MLPTSIILNGLYVLCHVKRFMHAFNNIIVFRLIVLIKPILYLRVDSLLTRYMKSQRSVHHTIYLSAIVPEGNGIVTSGSDAVS